MPKDQPKIKILHLSFTVRAIACRKKHLQIIGKIRTLTQAPRLVLHF